MGFVLLGMVVQAQIVKSVKWKGARKLKGKVSFMVCYVT